MFELFLLFPVLYIALWFINDRACKREAYHKMQADTTYVCIPYTTRNNQGWATYSYKNGNLKRITPSLIIDVLFVVGFAPFVIIAAIIQGATLDTQTFVKIGISTLVLAAGVCYTRIAWKNKVLAYLKEHNLQKSGGKL